MSEKIAELIGQASNFLGSDSALAARLEVPRQMVSMWKTGAKPCPPEDQARIAELVGLDPLEALVGAVLERHAGTPKGDALCRVLGKWAPRTQKAPDIAPGALDWRKRRDSNPR